MRVFVTSCETNEGAWRHQEELLRDYWSLSSKRHTLTEDPAEAEIILIGNIREENWYERFLGNPVIARYPNKCFGLSDVDEPKLFLRGIYTSTTTKGFPDQRFRSAAYTLYHPDFKNPFATARSGLTADAEKRYLFSFVGRNCHPVRDELFKQTFKRSDILVKDSSSFNLFTHANAGKEEKQKEFVDILAKSKFALCPRGNGAASIRLFEAMKMGVAPIIISDAWVLPQGLDWSRCALFVRENEIARLEEIITAREKDYATLGAAAADAYEQHFSERGYFDYIVDNCAEIARRQRIPEGLYWKLRAPLRVAYKFKHKLGR